MTDQPPGLKPFDLESPPKLLMPAYTPLRTPFGTGHRKTPDETALNEALAEAHVTWETLCEQLNDDPIVVAVLSLHKPERVGATITCTECSSYDTEGLSTPHWPCDTYTAISAADVLCCPLCTHDW